MKTEYDLDHPYQALAYYKFVEIKDPQGMIAAHKKFFESRDVSARIYISEEGINGQSCFSLEDAKAYVEWIQSLPEFSDMQIKVQGWHEQAFPRCTVKYRKQLVAMDRKVDLSKTGEHVSPERWREMMEEGEAILVDVRNDYEWKLGHFEGSELPACRTFRDFVDYADELKEKIDPKEKPVMMCCTGGIRCEIYSAFLKEKGFDKVYQLDGGIINYGAKENGKYWKGKLFVFDDRLKTPVGSDDKPVIGTCHHCNAPTERILNCANVECNDLVLVCDDCLHTHRGCCSETCMDAPRVRDYHEQVHKPFRRLSQS